jgi:hypothetical protein
MPERTIEPEKVVTFPTPDEFQAVLDATDDPLTRIVCLRFRIEAVANFKGDRTPTFEDIGRLVAFTKSLEMEVDEMTESLTKMREAIEELDYVRGCDNKNPNA